MNKNDLGWRASYYRQVVLKIPGMAGGNLGTSFLFDDQPDLRYARTLMLEVYFANDLTYSQPANIPVIPDSQAPLGTLVLNTNDPDDIKKEKGKAGRFTSTTDTVQYLPLTSIHRTQSFAGTPAPFVRSSVNWKDLYIVWQKTKFLVGTGGLANTTDLALVLGVYYTFLDEMGNPIVRT